MSGPSPQHLKEAKSPFPLHEKENSYGCLLVDNKRVEKSLSLSSPFSSSRDRREINSHEKKRGRSSVSFKRRVWSSPQLSTRHEQPSTSSSETRKEPPAGFFWQKKTFQKRRSVHLGRSSFHLKRNERLPLLARENKSSARLQKEEESFLQVHEKEEKKLMSCR